MDVAQNPDSKDKKEEVAQKPDSKDKTEEVSQSEVERGESSKRTYDDCTYQECPSLNISQASQMENAKKPKGDNIEEKPCVTTNLILPEIQEAENEYMNNKDKSAASYSKAMLLLSFIVGEADNLPLNPPFSLLVDHQKRIVQYIRNLQFHKKSLSESSSSEPHTLP